MSLEYFQKRVDIRTLLAPDRAIADLGYVDDSVGRSVQVVQTHFEPVRSLCPASESGDVADQSVEDATGVVVHQNSAEFLAAHGAEIVPEERAHLTGQPIPDREIDVDRECDVHRVGAVEQFTAEDVCAARFENHLYPSKLELKQNVTVTSFGGMIKNVRLRLTP